MTVTAYPQTLYAPTPLADLASRRERARLSASALKAFFNTMTAWRVRDEDAMGLLGGMAGSTYYALKKSPRKVLDEDHYGRRAFDPTRCRSSQVHVASRDLNRLVRLEGNETGDRSGRSSVVPRDAPGSSTADCRAT